MRKKQKSIIFSGQALVTLLFFMVIAITVTSAAVIVILVNSRSTTKYEEGSRAYYVAESGAENAVLRLLRDPAYKGEASPLTIGDGTAVITVTGTNPYTITSKGTVGSFIRTIQVVVTDSGGTRLVTSWKEN